MAARNNDKKTYTDQTGKFAPGNPGRPKGSRHKYLLAVENILDGEAERLTRRAIGLALEGDATALRLCLERILPARKDLPIRFDLPTVSSAGDAATAAQAVLHATSEGKLTPTEATILMTLVERFGRVLEHSEFEDRVQALEKAVEVGAK